MIASRTAEAYGIGETIAFPPAFFFFWFLPPFVPRHAMVLGQREGNTEYVPGGSLAQTPAPQPRIRHCKHPPSLAGPFGSTFGGQRLAI